MNGAFLLTMMMSARCPDGTIPSQRCSAKMPCSDGAICLADLDNTLIGESYCCGNVTAWCEQTGMPYYFSKSSQGYLHKFSSLSAQCQYFRDWTSDAACAYPYSHASSLFSKDLPRSFDTSFSFALGRCKTNSNCPFGYYCGASVNEMYGTNAIDQSLSGKPIRFCYKQKLPEGGILSTREDEHSLPFCRDNSDCNGKDERCTTIDTNHIYKTDNEGRRKSICLKYSLCSPKAGITPRFGRLVKTEDGFSDCTTNKDCSRDELYGNRSYTQSCVPSKDGLAKMCCFDVPRCDRGHLSIPRKSCKKHSDCGGVSSSWCDDRGLCCSSSRATDYMCPDATIPLINEPKCVGAKKSEPYSGNCTTQKGAICYYGHCCSGTTYDSSKKQWMVGAEAYVSKVKCNPTDNKLYSFAYCSTKTNTVVVGGKEFTETILATDYTPYIFWGVFVLGNILWWWCL